MRSKYSFQTTAVALLHRKESKNLALSYAIGYDNLNELEFTLDSRSVEWLVKQRRNSNDKLSYSDVFLTTYTQDQVEPPSEEN